MADLATKEVSRLGGSITFAAASAGGDRIPLNTGKEFFLLRNDDDNAVVVTEHITKTVDGKSVTNPTVSIAAGATVPIGPFPRDIYGDYVDLTYAAVTDLFVAVL